MILAAIFDLDGTLTTTPNPWRHIHEALGVWDRASAHFSEWLDGKIDYDEFCRKDTGLWQGAQLHAIHSFLDQIVVNRHVPAVNAGSGSARYSIDHHFLGFSSCRSPHSGSTCLGPALRLRQ
jgi:phosphoserine phosphatase